MEIGAVVFFMDKRVKDLVDFTRDKWGLENYYLHNYNFSRTLNAINETVYTLNMEWFPAHITHQEDKDYNPEGTAVIDLNMMNRQFESVIFVGGKAFTNGSVIRSIELNEIIQFIESETGLKYVHQFHLKSQDEKEFLFQSSIDGVAVSPTGTIEIKFDQEGKMTYFSLIGQFPSLDKVKVESFSLKYIDVEQVAKEQLKLIEFPSRKQKKWILIYCLEEIYLKNDQSNTLAYIHKGLVYIIDERIHWKKSIKKLFKRRQINVIENLTTTQVFSYEPHPDLIPLSDSEIKNSILTVKEFLSGVYSGDSGKWIVKTLQREKGYIFANLGVTNQETFMFKRKLRLFIDPKTFEVMNYIDNKKFIELYEDYQGADNININFDQAYESIKCLIDLKPVYVYDFHQKRYILCGKIDSDFGVNGFDGNVVELDHL